MILRGPAADADAGDQDRYLRGPPNGHHQRLVPDFWSVTGSPMNQLTCQATIRRWDGELKVPPRAFWQGEGHLFLPQHGQNYSRTPTKLRTLPCQGYPELIKTGSKQSASM